MTAPEGASVRIYYDADPGDALAVGDALVTRTGRTYIVIHARQQRRGAHLGRYHLRCVVAAGRAPAGVRVHPLCWYKRG